MDDKWIGYNLETFSGGVSSAVSPDLLPQNQVAWGMNADFRGYKVHTRPNIGQRMTLPSGLVQGLGYFNLQGGMLIAMIGGAPYRLRIGLRAADFSAELIPLPWYNSPIIKQTWMVQTPESFIIQDGQSDPIIYDGSTARRTNRSIPEVPLGLMMAYGNGRLWVAVNANQLVAGDIRTADPGSELKFTETQYLSGGGTISFAQNITGLSFIPVTGTTDYGALLVFGRNFLDTVRADITQRDAWASYPGFVTNAMRNVGTPSGWTIVQVNQDLFWRDALGGLRSINTVLSNQANAQYRGAPVNSNVSISREVSRLVDFDSQQLLGFSSGVYFNNRLLVTSSPFMNTQGGISHRDLVCLDFSPVSTMQGQAPAAYNGSWQGVNWTKLVIGEFNNETRAFGISSDEDGVNRLWEFETDQKNDEYIFDQLSNGSSVINPFPIEAFVEYPRVDFNEPKKRKRLTRCDVWLSELIGEVVLTAYWRPDNNQKWTLWDSTSQCATVTDDSTIAPHVWKNLLPEQRPLIKSFSIPDTVDGLSTYDLSTGFGFQLRLVWTGSVKIERAVLWATMVDDTDYVIREGQTPQCEENDVTGNEIVYEIPLSAPVMEVSYQFVPDAIDPIIIGCGFAAFRDSADLGDQVYNVIITSKNDTPLHLGEIHLENIFTDGTCSLSTLDPSYVLHKDDTLDFTITFTNPELTLARCTLVIPNNGATASCGIDFEVNFISHSVYTIDTAGIGDQAIGLALWVVTGTNTRALVNFWAIGSFTIGDTIDFTALMATTPITSLPGMDRQIFFTLPSFFGVSYEQEVSSLLASGTGASTFNLPLINLSGCFFPNFPAGGYGSFQGSTGTVTGIQFVDYTADSAAVTLLATIACDG